MKKILMLAACTAAMTAITSCSSNDEDVLAQAPVAPAAEETVAPEEQNSGIPLIVNATTDNGTRATELSNSNFNSFQLWAFQGTAPWVGNAYDGENLQTGRAMEKDGTWNAPGDYWPSTTANSVFYAISASYSTNNSLAPNITKNSASFAYTVAEDADNQEDLLVGTATAKASDDEGKVNIEFRHVLSKLNFTFKLNPATINGDELSVSKDMGFGCIIHQIKLHGLKKTGTFTIDSDFNPSDVNSFVGEWDDLSGDATITITPQSDIVVAAGFKYDEDEDEIVADGYGETILQADASITNVGLVLPQAVTAVWSGNTYASLSDAYIELVAKCATYRKDLVLDYVTGDGAALFTLVDNYYEDAEHHKVVRNDGVIFDFDHFPKHESVNLQFPTTDSDEVVGGYGWGASDFGWGSIYRPLGNGSITFHPGKPYRLILNLLNGINQNSDSQWGAFGTAGASRATKDIIICEE